MRAFTLMAAPETQATLTMTGVARALSNSLSRQGLEMRIDPIDDITGVASAIQRAEIVGIFKALQVDLMCSNGILSW